MRLNQMSVAILSVYSLFFVYDHHALIRLLAHSQSLSGARVLYSFTTPITNRNKDQTNWLIAACVLTQPMNDRMICDLRSAVRSFHISMDLWFIFYKETIGSIATFAHRICTYIFCIHFSKNLSVDCFPYDKTNKETKQQIIYSVQDCFFLLKSKYGILYTFVMNRFA